MKSDATENSDSLRCSSSFMGKVLISRYEDNEQVHPTKLVIVDLLGDVATGEEIQKWYCEKYDQDPHGMVVSRLPREIKYVR